MSHFRTGAEPASEGEAIQILEQRKLTESSHAADATLTVDQFIDGLVTLGAVGAGVALTTPTAAQIVAALPGAMVGMSFDFIAVNADNDQVLTITPGSGVTGVGTLTVAAGKNRQFKGVITNVGTPAVKLLGLAALA